MATSVSVLQSHGSLCAGGAGFACPRWRSSDLLRSRRSLEPNHRMVTCIHILGTWWKAPVFASFLEVTVIAMTLDLRTLVPQAFPTAIMTSLPSWKGRTCWGAKPNHHRGSANEAIRGASFMWRCFCRWSCIPECAHRVLYGSNYVLYVHTHTHIYIYTYTYTYNIC